MAYVTPWIICVQYTGDVQYVEVHRGMLSTSEGYHDVCGSISRVHRGEIMMHVGDIMMHDACGRYHE